MSSFAATTGKLLNGCRPAHQFTRIAVVTIAALAVAGCSDSARFSNGLFSSNTRTPAPSQADVTGSTNHQARVPTARVESQALPAPSRPATVAAGTATGGQGLGAYRPSADITGSVRNTPYSPPPAPAPVHTASVQTPPQSASGWTWEGGTPVTVGANDNIETIARKYGVPQSAIMQANNIKDTARVRPGQRLVIPRYIGQGNTHAAAAPVAAPTMTAPATTAPAMQQRTAAGAGFTHTVEPGQSLLGISRRYHKTVAEIAQANNLKPYAKLNAGDKLKIPGAAPAQRAAAAPQMQMTTQTAPQLAQPRTVPAQTQTVASAEPAQHARVATTAAPAEAPEPSAAKSAEAVGAIPSFRWPARGRVIAGYGSKQNGQNNDGINIAVPEGTPVKAAEDGTVAYSGNELKGYGNLVLIRHANGYVSAYAHASELLVKRGDTVKRGQIIGRAGQTGNVTSPQLHFEIRKGSTPVDPNQFLGG